METQKEELWAVLGEPIEVKLAGRTFKARQIPIRALFAWAEARIKSQAYERTIEIASRLSEPDKSRFLVAAVRDGFPEGPELMEAAQKTMSSVEAVVECLFQAFVKDQPSITRDEIRTLLAEADASEVEFLIGVLTGRKKQ